jgi:hypothetical protein
MRGIRAFQSISWIGSFSGVNGFMPLLARLGQS